MTSSPETLSAVRQKCTTPPLLVFFACAAAVTLLWNGYSYFTSENWNAIRVAPALMLNAGVTPYPGPLEGPVTTWVYGPVPLLWMMPASLGTDPASIMLTADALNVLLTLIPIALSAFLTPSLHEASGRERLFAAAIMVLCWPWHNLYFFQADNAALMFGVCANLILVRGKVPVWGSWLAATLTALSLWSKQNELGLVLGQIVFCVLRTDPRTAFLYTMRLIGAGAILGVVFALWTGAVGLYFNMFALPAAFPLAAWNKFFRPTFWPYAVLYILIPLAALGSAIVKRKRLDAAWLLPALIFGFSLPFGALGFLNLGGSVNSLHAYAYLVPATAVCILRWCQTNQKTTVLTFGIITALVLVGFTLDVPRRWHPRTQGLRQGMALAKQFPQAVYFPWNPLISWCAEHRFDHAEDGLVVRTRAGFPLPTRVTRAHLPPAMSTVAYQGIVNEGGILQLAPPDAQRTKIGEWTLISWKLPGR